MSHDHAWGSALILFAIALWGGLILWGAISEYRTTRREQQRRQLDQPTPSQALWVEFDTTPSVEARQAVIARWLNHINRDPR
jgi:hypothetical protein